MIGEALALTALDRRNGAIRVIVPKRGTVVIAEVKFRQIAMQMLLGTVLVYAAHSALKDRKIAFNRVGRDGGCNDEGLSIGALFVGHLVPIASVFLRSMVDGLMSRKLLADPMVELAVCSRDSRAMLPPTIFTTSSRWAAGT